MTGRLAVGALLLVILSGCVDPQNGAPSTGENPKTRADGEQTASGALTETPRSAEPPPDAPLFLNDCTGTVAWIDGYRPLRKNPQPEPWHQDSEWSLTRYQVFVCDRVGWGPYERGPVSMIFELEYIRDFPPNCAPTRGVPVAYVHAIYGDNEVVEALGKALHATFYWSDIHFDPGDVRTGRLARTAWTPDGFPESHIAAYPGTPSEGYIQTSEIYLSVDSFGSGSLALGGREYDTMIDTLVSESELAAPTLWATDAWHPPVQSSLRFDRQYQGEIRQWDTAACT